MTVRSVASAYFLLYSYAYDAKMDRLLIRMPKGQKDTIKEYAEKNGESVNGFINRLIAEALEK